jgi:hypothetical protein
MIDIEAAAALLPKSGDAARRLLGGAPPHAEAAEPARIADGRCHRRRAGAAHWRLKDRPFQVQSLGQAIARPHGSIPSSFGPLKPVELHYGATARIASPHRPRPNSLRAKWRAGDNRSRLAFIDPHRHDALVRAGKAIATPRTMPEAALVTMAACQRCP